MKLRCLWPLLLAGCSDAGPEAVRVFVAMSLKQVAEGIDDEWGKPVEFQFASTSTLARQIKEGAEADVLLSANPQWVKEVSPLEWFDWLGNRLVVIVPKDGPDVDLKKLDALVVGAPGVPCGEYARAALKGMGIAEPGRVISGVNVRDVVSKVIQGAAPAGIVYSTDAAIDPRVRVQFEIPEKNHPRIEYVAALLTERGRKFFEMLREERMKEIARSQGFIPR